MRAGLKNRVNGNQYYLEPNTLSQILSKEGISKLTFNSRIKPDPNFCTTGACEDRNNNPFEFGKKKSLLCSI